jgi:hypothetical protein
MTDTAMTISSGVSANTPQVANYCRQTENSFSAQLSNHFFFGWVVQELGTRMQAYVVEDEGAKEQSSLCIPPLQGIQNITAASLPSQSTNSMTFQFFKIFKAEF